MNNEAKRISPFKVALIVLLAVILVTGGILGYWYWYKTTHIFLDDAVYARNAAYLDLQDEDISITHYDQLQAQLPHCQILWSVPFQGNKYPNETNTLTVSSLTEEDVAMFRYFPYLSSVNAMAMVDYAQLEDLAQRFPSIRFAYQVELGGTAVHPEVTDLTLEEGQYHYDTLLENLAHLPQVTSLTLPRTTLSKAAVDAISEAYPGIRLDYTVFFRGQEQDPSITELDLSDMQPEELEQTLSELAFFHELQKIELMNAEGKSSLSLTDVQAIQEAVPSAQVHYTFTFYKKTLSTTDTQVEYKDMYMKDSDEAQIRQILDVMDSCERFVFNNCHISNKVMASLREDYRDRTKIVWRVFFGKNSSCLTDKEVIKVVGGLQDSNCQALMYCEDVRFIDFGHNDYLTDISYIKYMTKLEAIILSGSSIKDLTPFENHPSIYFLEVSNCSFLEDLTPLAGCEKLGMLNISYTHITTLEPIMHLGLDRLKYVRCKLDEESVAAYQELHPDCWVSNTGHEYGEGWRYEEDGSRSDYYAMLASKDVFNYDGKTFDTLW